MTCTTEITTAGIHLIGVLTRITDLRAYWFALASLGSAIVSFFGTNQHWSGLAVYLILVIGLMIQYSYTATHRQWREPILLLKYPGFVLMLVSEPLGVRSLAAAGLLYGIVLAFDHFVQRAQSA